MQRFQTGHRLPCSSPPEFQFSVIAVNQDFGDEFEFNRDFRQLDFRPTVCSSARFRALNNREQIRGPGRVL